VAAQCVPAADRPGLHRRGAPARCYYWRWRIESFFKLLKSHGQQLEHWQQQTGPAIARRLLVAAMACVTVWQLEADQSPAAEELKRLLVRLSGRQTKRRKPVTTPALLPGVWTLLSILDLLKQYRVPHLRQLAQQLPFRLTGERCVDTNATGGRGAGG